MTDIISDFEKARDFISDKVDEYAGIFVPIGLDAINKLNVIRGLQIIARQELKAQFPSLPEILYPKFVFKIHEEDMEVEVSIQCFINKTPSLTYLGSCDFEEQTYDLYYDQLSTQIMFPTVLAKYDHEDHCYITGSKSAEVDYQMQTVTPLSIAYKMAVDDGYIK
jgi:hypothetical protein